MSDQYDKNQSILKPSEVLVPLDGSAFAEAILPHTLLFAQRSGNIPSPPQCSCLAAGQSIDRHTSPVEYLKTKVGLLVVEEQARKAQEVARWYEICHPATSCALKDRFIGLSGPAVQNEAW